MNFGFVEQVHARLLITVQIQGGVQFFENTHIVNNQAKILVCVHSVHSSNGLQKRMISQLFIYIKDCCNRCIKAGK